MAAGTDIPKEALRSLIADVAELDPADVLWDGEPVPYPAPVNGMVQGRIVLNAVQRSALGYDEQRRTYNEDDTTTITQVGDRATTISVKAEMFGKQEGFDLLEQVRTRLGRETSLVKLREVDLSIASIEAIRSLPAYSDNRAIYVATMDLLFNQRITDDEVLPPGALGAGFIESVEVTGQGDLSIAGTDVIDGSE